jgi:hypothetical protein
MTFENKFLSKLPNKFVTIMMTKFVGYYDGQLKRFTLIDGQLSFNLSEKKFSPKLIVISSSFYQEQLKTYPINEGTELNKFLKIQCKENEFNIIQKIADNQSKVNSWHYDKLIPKCWLAVPETFLYGENLSDGEMLDICDTNSSNIYIAQIDNGIYSANSNKLIKTATLFGVSIGLSIQNQIEVSLTKKALLIANCLANIKLKKLISFIKRPSRSAINLSIKKFISPMAIGLILYFSITSAYLFFKTSSLKSEVATQTTQMTKLLELQVIYNESLDNYQVLSSFWQTRPNFVGLWDVLAPVFNKAKIKSVVLRGDKFLLIGQAKHASSLLESIIKNPNVKQAKFETPVRKDRGMERFNLSFSLHKGLAPLFGKVSNE